MLGRHNIPNSHWNTATNWEGESSDHTPCRNKEWLCIEKSIMNKDNYVMIELHPRMPISLVHICIGGSICLLAAAAAAAAATRHGGSREGRPVVMCY